MYDVFAPPSLDKNHMEFFYYITNVFNVFTHLNMFNLVAAAETAYSNA